MTLDTSPQQNPITFAVDSGDDREELHTMWSPLGRATAAGGMAAVLTFTVLGTAQQTAAAAPATPDRTAATPTAGQTVTLITGDVVTVSDAGAGRHTAAVRPAPGRERITFHTLEVDGGLRVLPSDVVPYVSSGAVDADLFDVEELLAAGYGDATATGLPLIVRYADGGANAMRTAGVTGVRDLPSIGGAALTASRDNLAGFWRATAPAAPTAADTAAAASSAGGVRARAAQGGRLGGGIERIWLDGRVAAALDRSVAQIGAPDAWAAGFDGKGVDVAILDTGVDANHPDLAGRIGQARNFTDSPDAVDRHGHGTHVAATVGGTGAASGGTRKGVAPGANLLVGKVLNDGGSGYESWIVAGMEWAVEQGAEVVSMSLGGSATDGQDPMSLAVDRLTASSGTLFVIAAGNEGSDYSVGSPGAAASALTVGAVDRDENLADFSSRGPRLGDEGLKPEITAPGVGIVAARAAGTSMGTVVDANHTTASGTSMATPHVAGAAALLAQAHPGWKAGQLKNALVSTARANASLTVYQQGAGRVDLTRAVAQTVYGAATADFGLITVAPAAQASTRTLTFTNTGSTPVTLDLAVDLRNVDRAVAETDALTTDRQVTVPAGGTADVTATLDPAKLDRGRHSGVITATGPGGIALRTAVGLTLAGPRHKVTLRALDPAGKPGSAPVVMLHGEDSRSDTLTWLVGDGGTVEVEEGSYLLQGLIEHGAPLDEQVTLVTDPELKITRDMTVVLDARKGTPIRIETPKPSEQQAILSYYVHRVHGNGRTISHGVMHFSTVQQVNVTPTRPVSAGSYEFSSRWQLVAPIVQAQIDGVKGPLDINLLHLSPGYDGPRKLKLVRAGTGTAQQLAAARVRDAVALVETATDRTEQEQIAAAAAAGAAAMIIVRPADWSAWTVWEPQGEREPIPAMVVAYDDGQKLLARTARSSAAIELVLTPVSPYLYDVFHVEHGRVPQRIVHRVTAANSMRIDTSYAHNGGEPWAREQRFGWRPWQDYSWNDTTRFVATPSTREEWVSAGDSMWQHRVHQEYPWGGWGPLAGGITEQPRSYRPGKIRETWFGPVVRPAAASGLLSTRLGDVLSLRVPEFVDAAGHAGFREGDEVAAMLWRDGTLVAELPSAMADVEVAAGAAGYRLQLTTARTSPEWARATRTDTVWEFRSGTADKARALPLLQVDYRVPADLNGSVAGRAHTVGLGLRHQAGLPTPRHTTLVVEVSFDEGKSWRAVRVTGRGDAYTAHIPAGSGSVSLRTRATDGAGNTVTQTVVRAYDLR
ncbi:S8 family serine peptidase [Catellatospora coxensis]|uniref:S8 family serine peptidase n=1 Tax=Catellatospora coxensis TaxID=310354 RepID=UPI001EF19EDF|nr:S8 family serine peptidase [Catellatospora coxensis]